MNNIEVVILLLYIYIARKTPNKKSQYSLRNIKRIGWSLVNFRFYFVYYDTLL